MKIKNILLVGYNGANNTGAEARLLVIIKNIREVFGETVQITIPSLSPANLRRYLQESDHLKIVRLPALYFRAIWRLVREHDLILLVEGSCYMDTWSSFLLWLWLWTTHLAKKFQKPIMAYGVDAGELKPFNQKLVRQEASKTTLIATRTEAAATRLQDLQVKAPLMVTADLALEFEALAGAPDLLQKIWPNQKRVIGIAPVDFYLWPVVMRLWGKPENCYRYPYYFSDSSLRRQLRQELVNNYIDFLRWLLDQYNCQLALICMEELDEPIARMIYAGMEQQTRLQIFSAKDYNAAEITSVLRGLDLLITSRYHAGILSLAAAVPQLAIGHDQRLRDLYQELNIKEDLFFEYDQPQLFDLLRIKVASIFANPTKLTQKLKTGYEILQQRNQKNQELLREFLSKSGLPN